MMFAMKYVANLCTQIHAICTCAKTFLRQKFYHHWY